MHSTTYGKCYSRCDSETMASHWLSQTQTQTQTQRSCISPWSVGDGDQESNVTYVPRDPSDVLTLDGDPNA